MREITIALAQTSPVLNDVSQNLAEMCRVVEGITMQQHVDLCVFPELATTGYDCGLVFGELAEQVDDHAVSTMARCAVSCDTHIVFGFAEKQKVESVVYSAAVAIDPDGEVIGDYQKVHLKGEQKLAFRPGFKFVTCETRFGVIGLMLSWDLAFPEVARSLALDGAEMLCVCGSWEQPHAHQWRNYCFARASENGVYVAGCNRVGQEPTDTFFGESVVVGPRGLSHGRLEGEEAGVLLATIDLDEVRRYQEEAQMLQTRQPKSYRAIVKMY